MSKSLEEYLNADPKALLATVAFTVETELPKITEHLNTLNDSVAKNTRRLNKIEMTRQVEEEVEGKFQNKLSRKQVVGVGGTGAGVALFIALVIYYLVQLFT